MITKDELFERIDEHMPEIRADVEEALAYYEDAGLREDEQIARFCSIAFHIARRLGL